MWSMPTGSSSRLRRQPFTSHGRVQTRPHTDGSGFRSLMSAIASRYLPMAASATYPWMSTLAGHAIWHGPMQSA